MAWYEFILLSVVLLSLCSVWVCLGIQEIRTQRRRRAFLDKLDDRLDLIAFHLQQIADKN